MTSDLHAVTDHCTWTDLPVNFTTHDTCTVSPSPEDAGVTSPLGLKIIIGSCIVLMLFVSILGNSIVCYVVYRKPAMRSATNILLANMAVSNILLAALCLPFAFVTLLLGDWVFGTVMCRIFGFLHASFVTEAVSILLAISVDRYLIIVCRTHMLTPFRARAIIVVTWCFSSLLSFPPTVGWGLYHYYQGWMQCVVMEHRSPADLAYVVIAFSVTFYLPMLIMSFCYAHIVRTVRQNSLRVDVQPQGLTIAQASRTGVSVHSPPWANVDVSFKTRAFKTIFILFIVYVICWMPYCVCLLAWNTLHQLEQSYIWGTVVLWGGYMNSTLNPVIYCWRIQKFREACVDMLPNSCPCLPYLTGATKRRVNPEAAYECNNVGNGVQQEQQNSVV